ncbi:39S ribosomal protein L38, mitochondrial [Agrilus planipennis]|uniref:Large ribosomal subunit protein mL38 n=1 Tax=Agrilus planipennis TaxID=224129 RepID=A0A1W4WF76_AGRPL|nr:39S ribosomal protein L38, mitochondrial [Agrilus planipennis]
MISNSCKLLNANFNSKLCSTICVSVRHGHHMRGKPPGVARTLEQRLAEINYKDPKLYYKVDIGLPHRSYSVGEERRKRMAFLKARRNDPQFQKLSKSKNWLIKLDEVKSVGANGAAQYQLKEIATHFSIFDHLFGDAYFVPRVPLQVQYSFDSAVLPVYSGNVIKPSEAAKKPIVNYDANDGTLWSVLLTCPDGNFTEQNAEYIHWFVGNIPGNKITDGETVVEYLQPIPPKGTGFHRYIFILYKQEKLLDFSSYKINGPGLTLAERNFKTYDFYKERQDDITPAGLAFFQSDWDKSLKDFFHNKLNMREPIFEYDFPPPYIRPQEWFPKRKPFNIYMDKYRDPKQINKEFLERKLKNVHPFKAPPPPLPYPNARYFEGYVPSWLKEEIRKSRLGWGRINDIK